MRSRIVFGIAFLIAVLSIIASCQSQDDLDFKRYYVNGRLLYLQRCQNCHGANGEGLSNLIPPLTDTVFLKKNRRQLACIVNLGLKNKLLIINGKSFTTDMPANDMPAVDIAEVVTYVTNSFGNKQGVMVTDSVAAYLQQCR